MKKNFKVLFLTISILIVSICTVAVVFANDNIIVQLNGEEIVFTDSNGNKVPPQIMNGRTMVPMRKIFESLGASVEWDGANKVVTGIKGDTQIKLQIGNNIATKTVFGKTENIKLDVSPVIVNERTLVPVRFIAESLDQKVGWDAKKRAVIIIDVNSLEQKLKNNASNLYEILTNEYEPMKTQEVDFDMKVSMKEVDTEEVQVNGNANVKLSENALKIDFNLQVENTPPIKGSMILDFDNCVMYILSDSIKNSDGKWVKYVLEGEAKEILKPIIKELIAAKNLNIKAVFNSILVDEDLDLNSYKNLDKALEVITKLFGNNNLKKVSDTKYKLSLDKDCFFDALLEGKSNSIIKKVKETAIFDMSFEIEIEDNVAKKSNVSIVYGDKVGVDEDKVQIDVTAILKNYNKDIKIKYPSSENVITSLELERKNASPVIKDIVFSGFATEIRSLEECVRTAIVTEMGNQAIKGFSRSKAQLANYVARGGANVLTSDEPGDKKWLIQSDATTVPCTLIDKQYAEDILGIGLPVRKVETYQGTLQEMSYFVTPKGQVFCWPPYIYDDKSYVTNNVTVRNIKTLAKTADEAKSTYSTASEITGTNATKNGSLVLYFPSTQEQVVVINANSPKEIVATKGNVNASTKVGVWYDTTRNVIDGIDFTSYDNTLNR